MQNFEIFNKTYCTWDGGTSNIWWAVRCYWPGPRSSGYDASHQSHGGLSIVGNTKSVPVKTADRRKRETVQLLGPVSINFAIIYQKISHVHTQVYCSCWRGVQKHVWGMQIRETPSPSIAYLLSCNEICRSNYEGPPACKVRAEYISIIFVQLLLLLFVLSSSIYPYFNSRNVEVDQIYTPLSSHFLHWRISNTSAHTSCIETTLYLPYSFSFASYLFLCFHWLYLPSLTSCVSFFYSLKDFAD
jgi:hypothetical protein